ncbi:MAG TPA: hypothetical protein DCW33_02080 [Proteobacteria bacterium]|nr:hypothetical protein [Pseudomonadota bacterium]
MTPVSAVKPLAQLLVKACQALCLISLLHQNALASSILLAIPTEADDPFYRLIEHGAVAAAEAHKVDLKITHYSNKSPQEEKKSVDQILKSQRDMLIFGLFYKDTDLKAALVKNKRSFNTIQVINSGAAQAKLASSQINYIGMNDYSAGLAMGNKLIDIAPQKILFVTHLPEKHIAVQARKSGIEANLTNVPVKILDISNSKDVLTDLKKAQKRYGDYDTVVFMGPHVVSDFMRAYNITKDSPRVMKLVAFDLSATIAEFMTSGHILFTIDQQPYAQGYFAVTNAAMWIKGKLYPTSDMLTGPQLIYPYVIPKIYDEIGTTR